MSPRPHLRVRILFASGVLLGGATIAGAYTVAAATASAVAATFVPAAQVQGPRVVAFACKPHIARTGSRPPKLASVCTALRNPRHRDASS